MKTLIIFCTLVVLHIGVDTANILAVIPAPFYSHQATYRPIWRELAKRGHKITLITTNLMESNNNITQIDFSEAFDVFKELKLREVIDEFSIWNGMRKLMKVADRIFEFEFTHPGLLELMQKNPSFDLLMLEWLPGFNALSCRFKVPFIQLTTIDLNPSQHSYLGNAMNPSIYPAFDLGLESPLNFEERLWSSIVTTFLYVFPNVLPASMVDNYIKKYISGDCPHISDIDKKASLSFINANPVFHETRPISSTTINLKGGLSIREPQVLPQDLQEYLDQAQHGCIYFSLGTTVNSNALTTEVIEIFKKTFEQIAPMRVLWKFENDTLDNKPKNLEIRKWLPQQDVLRHSNVKLFITQGGLQSMEEAVEYAVPMIGIPFYGDQVNNVNKMVRKQFGMKLDIKNFNQTLLQKAIQEILNNPIYRNNIEKYSRIQRDRPMSALDTAVWWTEYVLRHGGTEHLRSPSADIPLYQYFFLDILAFVIVFLILSLLALYYSIKLMKYIFLRVLKLLTSGKVKQKKN